jgi:putative addiction module component (TIGR02574 family)
MAVIAEAEELALSLSESDRGKLAEKLIASLPTPHVHEDEDWVNEALRRDREMDDDPGSVMTHEQFFASIREHIK